MSDEPANTPASPPARDAAPAYRSRRALILFTVAAVAMLAFDLASKYAAFHYIADVPVVLTPEAASHPYRFWSQYPHEPIPVVPSLLSLRLTTNPGAIFGIAEGGRWVFVAVSIFATALILVLFARSSAKAFVTHFALAGILAGALGNLYDRVLYAQVRDLFWLFPGWELPFGLAWPGGTTDLYPWIFNFADVTLVVGVSTILLLTFIKDLMAHSGGGDSNARAA